VDRTSLLSDNSVLSGTGLPFFSALVPNEPAGQGVYMART
jgi:hypothetical protein